MKLISGKPKRRKRSLILRLALLVFGIYVVASIVNQQLTAQNLKNDELKMVLQNGAVDSDEFIERKAREELDYAKPNELVFVNISGD